MALPHAQLLDVIRIGPLGPAVHEAVKLPAASQPAIVQVLVLPLALDADESAAAPMAASAEARPPPDPIFLSTLRLRV